MPDVPYVWYQLLTTFLGAAPLFISDSDRLPANCPSGSGSGSASLHYICIRTWETFQIKKNTTRVQIASHFLHWNTYTWHCSLAIRRRNASEKCQVYSNGKSETRFNASGAVFLPFHMAKTICQLVAWFKIQEWLRKASRSVGSVTRSVMNRVGRLGRSSWWKLSWYSAGTLSSSDITWMFKIIFAKLNCSDIAWKVGRKWLSSPSASGRSNIGA